MSGCGLAAALGEGQPAAATAAPSSVGTPAVGTACGDDDAICVPLP